MTSLNNLNNYINSLSNNFNVDDIVEITEGIINIDDDKTDKTAKINSLRKEKNKILDIKNTISNSDNNINVKKLLCDMAILYIDDVTDSSDLKQDFKDYKLVDWIYRNEYQKELRDITTRYKNLNGETNEKLKEFLKKITPETKTSVETSVWTYGNNITNLYWSNTTSLQNKTTVNYDNWFSKTAISWNVWLEGKTPSSIKATKTFDTSNFFKLKKWFTNSRWFGGKYRIKPTQIDTDWDWEKDDYINYNDVSAWISNTIWYKNWDFNASLFWFWWVYANNNLTSLWTMWIVSGNVWYKNLNLYSKYNFLDPQWQKNTQTYLNIGSSFSNKFGDNFWINTNVWFNKLDLNKTKDKDWNLYNPDWSPYDPTKYFSAWVDAKYKVGDNTSISFWVQKNFIWKWQIQTPTWDFNPNLAGGITNYWLKWSLTWKIFNKQTTLNIYYNNLFGDNQPYNAGASVKIKF